MAGRIGAPGISGPMISRACATSVAALAAAAGTVAAGASTQLVVTTDRTSNGPVLIYPEPNGMGGAPRAETWVLDSFGRDPWAGGSMIAAGETVARKHGITRDELDDLTLLRSDQYGRALADDRAFQRRYQVPVELSAKRGRGIVLHADERVRPASLRRSPNSVPSTPRASTPSPPRPTPPPAARARSSPPSPEPLELARGNGIVRVLATGTARVA